MTTTTALSISHAARVGADLFDRAAAAGLPTHLSMSSLLGSDPTYMRREEVVRFQFYGDDFSDIRAWATWLDVDAAESPGNDPSVTFCRAEARVDGVRVELTSNLTAES